MNLSKFTVMASLFALTGLASCEKEAEEVIIEQPQVKIENGHFTPEALMSMGAVTDPQVSPDGTKVLYGVKFESIEQNKSNRELWVVGVDGSNPTRITTTAKGEQNAVWINGGNKIAFLYPQDGKMQIWTMNPDGTDRKVVSNVENGVDGFVLSPDETKVAFISQVKWGTDAKDLYPEHDKANVRIITDMMYKHWDEWVKTIPHSFVADFDGAQVTNIVDMLQDEPYEAPMKPFGGVESLAWAPDGKSVVYVSRKKTGMAYALSTNSDLYQYNLETKETKNLTEGMMGYDTNPRFSKSGRYLAWLSMERDGYESDMNRIFILDMENGEKKHLTANWDYAVDQMAWSPNEKAIFFTAPYLGCAPMFKIDVETAEITTIADGEYDYAAVVPVNDDTVITLRHSLQEPNEVYAVTAGEVKKLSTVNDEMLASLNNVTVKKVLVPTTDGKQMTTWVVLPPNFDETKKYPAILYCQGGPQQPVSQFWSYRWNLRLMASQGYIVIAPNRRGLPGFGTEWNEQISGDYPGQNMKDYFAAVDHMKKEPYVDGDHIGAVGASYGGFSVYWLAGNHEGRFKALIAHAGIVYMEAQYLETEEMWFANWDMGGAFWEKDNKVAQRTFACSPHKYVKNWTAPILITAGELDYRILSSQAEMAFNAATLLGVPAKMVLYPDENHWILKPQNSLIWQKEFFAWLDKYLKEEAK